MGFKRGPTSADLMSAPENTLENLKVLYSTGAVKLNDETGEPERVGGVRWTSTGAAATDGDRVPRRPRELSVLL